MLSGVTRVIGSPIPTSAKSGTTSFTRSRSRSESDHPEQEVSEVGFVQYDLESPNSSVYSSLNKFIRSSNDLCTRLQISFANVDLLDRCFECK